MCSSVYHVTKGIYAWLRPHAREKMLCSLSFENINSQNDGWCESTFWHFLDTAGPTEAACIGPWACLYCVLSPCTHNSFSHTWIWHMPLSMHANTGTSDFDVSLCQGFRDITLSQADASAESRYHLRVRFHNERRAGNSSETRTCSILFELLNSEWEERSFSYTFMALKVTLFKIKIEMFL